MDVYKKLMERLDEFPTGAPNTEHLEQILKILLTEEEALLATKLPLQPLREPLTRLSKRVGESPSELKPKLDQLADKGVVFCYPKEGEPAYALLPLVPGIFELQFMKPRYDAKAKALAKLFNEYFFSGWGRESFNFNTSYTRTIPIEKAIAPGQTIEPYRNVKELIENSKKFALTNCFCRHEHELIGDWCKKPKDVCMIFGPFVDFAVERGFARRVDKQEMFEKLEQAEKAGLVHITDNIREKINFICNCCGCCCGFLTAVNKLNLPGVVANSGFIASFEEDKCTNCGLCVKQCQLKALWMEDVVENGKKKKRLVKNLGRCVGCGLCVSACKENAITLVRRKEEEIVLPKESFIELGVALIKERQLKKGGVK